MIITISPDEQLLVTSKGRSEEAAGPGQVPSKLVTAINGGKDTLSKLTDHFKSGGLAPRSKEAVAGRAGTEKYIRDYLSWMIKNGWITR